MSSNSKLSNLSNTGIEKTIEMINQGAVWRRPSNNNFDSLLQRSAQKQGFLSKLGNGKVVADYQPQMHVETESIKGGEFGFNLEECEAESPLRRQRCASSPVKRGGLFQDEEEEPSNTVTDEVFNQLVVDDDSNSEASDEMVD